MIPVIAQIMWYFRLNNSRSSLSFGKEVKSMPSIMAFISRTTSFNLSRLKITLGEVIAPLLWANRMLKYTIYRLPITGQTNLQSKYLSGKQLCLGYYFWEMNLFGLNLSLLYTFFEYYLPLSVRLIKIIHC